MNSIRDIRGDYVKALLEERSNALRSGDQTRANAVAVELNKMGHQVDKVETGVKERAVAEPPLETAVDEVKPRRGRPKKAAE